MHDAINDHCLSLQKLEAQYSFNECQDQTYLDSSDSVTHGIQHVTFLFIYFYFIF